jgi:hypothetical protein
MPFVQSIVAVFQLRARKSYGHLELVIGNRFVEGLQLWVHIDDALILRVFLRK